MTAATRLCNRKNEVEEATENFSQINVFPCWEFPLLTPPFRHRG